MRGRVATGEPVVVMTSTASATWASWSPASDRVSATHSPRYSRSANTGRRPIAGGGFGAGREPDTAPLGGLGAPAGVELTVTRGLSNDGPLWTDSGQTMSLSVASGLGQGLASEEAATCGLGVGWVVVLGVGPADEPGLE